MHMHRDVVEQLFFNLMDELGEDLVGAMLLNLAKAALEGKLDKNDKNLLREALDDLFEAQEDSEG